MKDKRQIPEESLANQSRSMATRHTACKWLLVLSFFAITSLHFLSCSPPLSIVPRQRQLDGVKVSPFQYAKPETVGISSKSLHEIGDQIAQWVKRGHIVGAEWLIIKDRKIVMHEAVGWKNLEENIPMTIDTIFRIRSMTKPFVGTSILMLAEEGKLQLSDPVSKFLPSFANEKSREVTVKHLLSHTGGFAKRRDFSFKNYSSLRETVDSIGTTGPQYPPGTRYKYSNSGYATLGAVVAEVSGMPLEDFIQIRVLSPLAMTDTFCNLARDDPRRKRVSCTYANTIFGLMKYWDNSQPQVLKYFRACAGMYSTPIDYAKFLLMWMDKGKFDSKQLLSPDSVRKALECEALSIKENVKGKTFGKRCYGMMWQLVLDKRNETVAFGHSGSDGTIARAYPEKDTMVFYFTQSKEGSEPGYFGKFLSLMETNLHLNGN